MKVYLLKLTDDNLQEQVKNRKLFKGVRPFHKEPQQIVLVFIICEFPY